MNLYDVLCGRTNPQLNTPFNNPLSANPTEIEVTDPRHPLFGRHFPVLSISRPPQGEGHVIVAYQDHITLRIPVAATNLVSVQPRLATKLTVEAVTELISLAEQYEVICPTHRQPSGTTSPQKSKIKLSTNSQ
jgi:hypothetical protein